MVYNFLLVLLILDSIVLIAAVLLQSGKGGGLAASFGGAGSSPDAFMGTRQAGNLLTKASWWCGGIFLGLAFLLSMISVRPRTPGSVLDQIPGQQAPATAPAPGNQSGAPAIPLEPAQPTQPAPVPTTPANPPR